MYIQYPDGRTTVVITTAEIKRIACKQEYSDWFQKANNGLLQYDNWTPETCRNFLGYLNNIADPVYPKSCTLITQLETLVSNHVIPKINLTGIHWPLIHSNIIAQLTSDTVVDCGLENANFSEAELDAFDNCDLNSLFSICCNTNFSNAKFPTHPRNSYVNANIIKTIAKAYHSGSIVINRSLTLKYNQVTMLYNKYNDWTKVSPMVIIDRMREVGIKPEQYTTFYRKFPMKQRQEINVFIAKKYDEWNNYLASSNDSLEPVRKRAKK